MGEQNKEEKYRDLLLTETQDGKLSVVEAPASIADEGGIVLFNGGKVGWIRQRAFLFDDDPMAGLLKAVAPVFQAEAIYPLSWKRPENGGHCPSTPTEGIDDE